ncbi:MAG: dihydropteroate synthase [Clostridiales bacterium]|nr:dihydropteroate synthase [Clostridiales bacterium]
MIVIGEKLNSSIPSAFEAMKNGDEAIISLIKAQEEAGANYLDINTALFEDDELDMMKKVLRLVLDNSDCGIVLDSPNPDILAEAAKGCEGRDLILNSVTTDERIDELTPVIAELGCGVVVLPINKVEGIPDTAEGRLAGAKAAIEKLTAAGISEDRIYIDAICETLATNDTNAKTSIETIRLIKSETGANTVCGLSNVSFGLPKRAFINSAFLSIALYCGLDAAIIDPCSKELKKARYSASAVSGADEYCMEYISFIREDYM